MSNPAVIVLAEVSTSMGNFRIEDNIGESIHIHLGEFRYDLTIQQFLDLADDINETMRIFTGNIPGFELSQISKEFFSQKAECWSDLLEVKREKIKLGELMVDTYSDRGKGVFKKLPYSRVVKALEGNTRENDERIERNYYNQSNQQRVNSMFESIEKHGYPKNNEYIIVFNDENIIADGQHRAACLYHLKGNVNVPILRMIFKDNKHSSDDSGNRIVRYLFEWDKERLKRLYRKTRGLVRLIKNKLSARWMKLGVKRDIHKYRRK